MKKLALILITLSGAAWSAEEFTIQTISALKESSITPAFEKKVHESALASETKKEGKCNIVTVGAYHDIKTARHDLKKAKTIASDAFVRPVIRTAPKVCEGSTVQKKEIVSKEGATVHKSETAKTTVANEATAPKHEESPQSKTAVVETSATHLPVQTSAEQKSAELSAKASTPCKSTECSKAVYVYDRNLLHKSDISEAIAYYKNSPYHSFAPIGLPR